MEPTPLTTAIIINGETHVLVPAISEARCDGCSLADICGLHFPCIMLSDEDMIFKKVQ